MNNETFVKITNTDIFNKLVSIEQNLNKQRGTLKWHTWAIGIIVVLIASIISRII